MKTYADRHDDGRRKRRRSSSLNRFQDELGSLDEDQLQFMVDAPNDYVNDIFNQFEQGQETAGESAHLITEDELSEAEGLMGKSEFLELAEASVRTSLQESFEGTGFTEKDCPWLKHLFRHYGRRNAKYLEHSIHKYLPGTKQAESVEEYIAPLGEKVQRAIGAWLKTGQITEVPAEIPRSLMRVAGQDAANQRARMGKGQDLDSSTKSKMEGAFGASLSDVKVHTENEGSAFAEELDAQAVTIGKDIAFGAGKYKPGTPEGDALIAHELAHVMQQQGATETGEMGSGADYAAMEQDAEGATRGVMGRLWGGMKSSFADLKANAWPRLRSGLQVQRCKEDKFGNAMQEGETAYGNDDFKLAKEKFTEALGYAETDEEEIQAREGIAKAEVGLNGTPKGVSYNANVGDIPKTIVVKSSKGDVIYEGKVAYDSVNSDRVAFDDLKADTYSALVTTNTGEESIDFNHSVAGPAVLFLKFTTADDKEYKPATNFEELIDLMRVAEEKLKTNGQDVQTRIKTLRGIFYGTDWSLDFVGPPGKKGEGSAMRNAGFNYFISGPDAIIAYKTGGDYEQYVPKDPRTILGQSLYDAIFNTFEVTNTDGRMVDVGHLLIGMEARGTSREAREDDRTDPRTLFTASMGGSGLEITTWLGDLGGGTGQLARARIKDPDASAMEKVFGDLHSYGASVNLEGDIDAFVIASDENQGQGKPLLLVTEELGLTGALKDYFNLETISSAWKNRAKIFLTMYGATFDVDGKVSNEDELKKMFAPKIKAFAYSYMETRISDEANEKRKTPNLTPEQQKEIDEELSKFEDKLPAAAEEVAGLFIQALIGTMNDPYRQLKP